MSVSLQNTTLNLSSIDQLREIVSQTNTILATSINPFTIENLNKSDWWQYANALGLISQALVGEGYEALTDFSVAEINNNTLPITLIEKINASLSSGGSTVLLLMPNGATESVDGEYQRFEPIDPIAGTWIAQLAMEDWQDALVVQFKAPALTTADQELSIYFIYGDMTVIDNRLNMSITNGSISFGVFGGISTTYSAAQPASDTVITLTITASAATIEYGEVSETIDTSTDYLAVPFNCAVSSVGFGGDAVLPLSIKVQPLSEA